MSKTPLSEVFLGKKQVTLSSVDVRKGKQPAENKLETVINEDLNIISLKILVNEDNGEVLYAEAKDDFVNLLLSFLTFPLGSIIKLLNGHSMLECVDNLYNSVEVLGNCEDDYIKSESSKAMLKNPKLAHFFGCDNQILKMEEMPPPENDSFEFNGFSHLELLSLYELTLFSLVQALNILKSSLISGSALSHAFSSMKTE